MAKKLLQDDGKAIDLLLDHQNDSAASTYVRRGKSNIPKRIQAAERMLNLLHELPVSDPPADLLSRTLEKVATAPPVPSALAQQPAPGAASDKFTS